MSQGSSSQIRAGNAYVAVTVRDETRAALQQIRTVITQSLRDTAQQANTQLVPIRQNLVGVTSGASKFQLVASQLSYAIEDASSQFGTQGFAGALRAASNNLTFIAAQLGGVRAQMMLTAGVVALQLLPMIAKIGDAEMDLTKPIADGIRVIERGAIARGGKLDREEITGRVRSLITPEAVAQRQVEVDARKRRIEVVDMVSVQQQIQSLQDMRKEIASHADSKNADMTGLLRGEIFSKAGAYGISQAWAEFWGKLKPEEVVRDLDSKIGDARNRQLKLTEELATLDFERAKLLQQQLFAENQRRADIKKDLRGSMIDAADALAGDDWLERQRIEQERLDNFKQMRKAGLLDDAANPSRGVDAINAANRLADLQRRRLALRDFDPALMPRTLDQGSSAAARQFEMNRRQQFDPAVTELKQINQEARDLRALLEEILGQFVTP